MSTVQEIVEDGSELELIAEPEAEVETKMLNGSSHKAETDDPENPLILWVDVETDGLSATKNSLLQVAGIITDIDGNIISDEFYETVYYSAEDSRSMRANAIPFVQSMHDETGLWDQLPEGIPLQILDSELLEFVKQYIPKAKAGRLAGNSVRLDLNFSEEYLPETYAHLHYRSIDVSALMFALKEWGVVDTWFEKKKTHNALDDIRESIQEYVWLRKSAVELLELAKAARDMLS